MFSKLFSFLTNNLLLVICLFVSIVSLTLSVSSFRKSSANEIIIVEVQASIADLHTDLIARLDAIDAHMLFLDKYAQAQHNFFYGNIENGFVGESNSANKIKKFVDDCLP